MSSPAAVVLVEGDSDRVALLTFAPALRAAGARPPAAFLSVVE